MKDHSNSGLDRSCCHTLQAKNRYLTNGGVMQLTPRIKPTAEEKCECLSSKIAKIN